MLNRSKATIGSRQQPIIVRHLQLHPLMMSNFVASKLCKPVRTFTTGKLCRRVTDLDMLSVVSSANSPSRVSANSFALPLFRLSTEFHQNVGAHQVLGG